MNIITCFAIMPMLRNQLVHLIITIMDDNAAEQLKNHLSQRNSAVTNYIGQ